MQDSVLPADGGGIEFKRHTRSERAYDDPRSRSLDVQRLMLEVYDALRLSNEAGADSDVSRRATANFLQYEEWIDGYILGRETSLQRREGNSATGVKSTLANGFPSIAMNIDRTLSRMRRSPYSRKCAARLSEVGHATAPSDEPLEPPASRHRVTTP